MKKYIHYCWFGDKPLPRLAKKCIKSWKKYLPDYEIIRWSEENVNLEECPFIKEAYENKKWAFVADYARVKAIYEYGGIYFDTDMIITKDISFLLDKETFLGVEDTGMANAAVWGAAKPKTEFSKKVLDFYRSQKHFNVYDIYAYSIPRVLMRILDEYNFEYNCNDIQILDDGKIYIYPREYFYPLSYDYQNNVFTDNTCMIHYFSATWISEWEQRENKICRLLGKKNGYRFIRLVRFTKRNVKRCIKAVLYPLVLYVRYKRKISKEYLSMIDTTVSSIEKYKNDYIVFHNPEWLGVTNATIELFDNRIPCKEILRKKDIEKIGNAILENNITQVIFSALCIGWLELGSYLKDKNKDIKIKVYWHGSHSQVFEPYGWHKNLEAIELCRKGIVDVFATCKKSMIRFYENENIKTTFITNKVNLSDDVKKYIKNRSKKKNEKIRIGIYAARTDYWIKNLFTQITAISLMDNVILDLVPLNDYAVKYANLLNLEVDGINKSLSRDELIKRMSINDVNLYVTLSECSPMLNLESMEAGVPCITGNNHHYFKGTELEKYLIVNNEENAYDIKEKIEACIKHKDEIMKLYNKWSKDNKKQSKNDVKHFLDM